MMHIAIVLIASLLASCASSPPRGDNRSLSPVSMHGWHQLQTSINGATNDFRLAITKEVESRTPLADQETRLRLSEWQESQALLLDLLTHSQNPALLSDAAFEKVQDVALGKNKKQYPFAQGVADYFTQTDFNCRHPLYAAYFQNRFGKRATDTCPSEVPFAVATRYDGEKIVWLAPRKVRSIHLLFAGKSNSFASRFGHVALRLVVCPEETSSAFECDSNLPNHLILGFRAQIDELSLNSFKALTGDYSAYLFANYFMDVYKEYAIDEFRDIYSLPLRLDDIQREHFVRDLAEIHWGYAGEYKFLTQNCATMTDNALKQIWTGFISNEKMASEFFRPDSLFDSLKSTSLAAGDKFDNLDIAEQDGYYFSSTKVFYERALTEVREAMTNATFTDMGSYLQTLPVKRQQSRLNDKKYMKQLLVDQHLREAQIMLEEYAILHSMRMLMIEAAKYFEQINIFDRIKSIRSQLDTVHAKVFDDCLITPIKQNSNPVKRLGGIPSRAENVGLPNMTSTCQTDENKKLLLEAIADIKDTKSAQWQKLVEIAKYLADSITNLELLKQI